ncbi:MAG: hypothetical protein AB7V50_03095 [Vampirovibrionia bacterium]
MIGSFLVGLLALLLFMHLNSGNKKFFYMAACCCMLALLVKQDFFISCTGSFVMYNLILPVRNIDFNNLFTKHNIDIYLKNNYFKELIVSLFFIGLVPFGIFYLIGLKVGLNNILHGIFPSELYTLVNPTTEIFCIDSLRSVLTVDNFLYFISYGIGSALLIAVFVAILYFIVAFYRKHGLFRFIILVLSLIFVLLVSLLLFSSYVLGALSWVLFNLNNVYSGLNLWLILFILYNIFNIRKTKDIKIIILALIALSLNYRMFYGLTLNVYTFYYLPVSLIVFVYILSSLVPEIFSNSVKFSRETYKYAIYSFLVLYVACYFFFLTGLYGLKNVMVKTQVDTHYTQSFIAPKYKAINDASNYIIANTTKEDKIQIFPSFLIIYLFTDRLPASSYYYLVPGTTTKQEEELKVISDLESNKPRFIVVHNNKSRFSKLPDGKYEWYEFGSEHQYKKVFEYVESNYTLDKIFSEDIHNIDKEDEKVIINIYKIKETL